MNSIYYYLNKNNKWWNVDKNLKLTEIKNVLDKQEINIKSKRKNTKLKRTFVLTPDNLYYVKNEDVKGYFSYDFIGLTYNNSKKKLFYSISLNFLIYILTK